MPALRFRPVARRSAARRLGMGSDRGSAAVELAILAPAILLVLFASIQAACYFMARSVAITAAQEAVSAERTYNAIPGAGYGRAGRFLAGTGDWLGSPQVTVVRVGDQVTVTVRGRALSVIPGASFDVSQTAHGQVEHFTTEDPP